MKQWWLAKPLVYGFTTSWLLFVLCSCLFCFLQGCSETPTPQDQAKKLLAVPTQDFYKNSSGQLVETVLRGDLSNWLAAHKHCRIDSMTAVSALPNEFDAHFSTPTFAFVIIYTKVTEPSVEKQ